MASQHPRVIGTTSGGKTLEVYNLPNCSLLGLRFREGGELPAHISENRWSNTTDVFKAGEAYLKELEEKPAPKSKKKVKKNAETGCDD